MPRKKKRNRYGYWDRGIYIEIEYSKDGPSTWLAYDEWPTKRPNIGGAFAMRADEAEQQALLFVDEHTGRPRQNMTEARRRKE